MGKSLTAYNLKKLLMYCEGKCGWSSNKVSEFQKFCADRGAIVESGPRKLVYNAQKLIKDFESLCQTKPDSSKELTGPV